MHDWPKKQLAVIYNAFEQALIRHRAAPDDAALDAAMKKAVDDFMAAHFAAGALPGTQPGELQCAQCLQEVFDRVDTTDEEYTDWSDRLADAAGY